MDALDCLFTRRSIRKFTPDPVSRDAIVTAIQAAMSAPSAGNAQPWHFVVITDRAKLDAVPGFHPYAAMTREAQAAVLVCADPGMEKYPGHWPLDCANAAMNLLLALHAQGLGGVWVGVYPDKDRQEHFRELLGLPENIQPHCFIPIGFPDMPCHPAQRFRPERIHDNAW